MNSSEHSNLQQKAPTIGFSVRDILDLPTSSNQTLRNRVEPSQPINEDHIPMDPNFSTMACHPSAFYYCVSSYLRWLSPSTSASAFSYPSAVMREFHNCTVVSLTLTIPGCN